MDHSGLPLAFGSLCARLAVFHIERMKHEHRRSMASRAGPGAERAVAQSEQGSSVISFALPEAAEGGMAEQGPSPRFVSTGFRALRVPRPSEFTYALNLKLSEAKRAHSELQ